MHIQNQALIAEIERFKTESLKMHIVKVWADSYVNSNPFGYAILQNGKVWWMKVQAHQLWEMWQAAKTHEPQWISVNDMLPSFGSRVLVLGGKYADIGNYDNADSNYPAGFWNDGFGSIFEDVTHWMPLPDTSQEQA